MNGLRLPMLAALLVAGCASPPHPYVIRPGGYLEEKDYAALQKRADKVKPLPLPKSWPNPSPMWSYHMETNVDFSQFTSIAIPELTARNVTEWKGPAGTLTNLVANAVAAALVQKKLFQEANRTNTEGPLALVGAVTFYQDGSVAHAVLFGPGRQSIDFLQAEFKVVANGKQVGVIQAQAARGKNLVAVMAMAVIERQIADGVAEVFKRLKANKLGEASEGAILTGWFMK